MTRAGLPFLLCGLALAGCAAGDPARPTVLSKAEERVGAPRGLPNLFISPFGEPFHAERGAPYPVAVWFAQADRDHDGRLTEVEFVADANRFFGVLDTDGDGVLDGFEVAAYERRVAPEILPRIEGLRAREGWTEGLERGAVRSARGERGEDRGGGLTQGAGLFSLVDEPEPVAASDANLDGKITRAEFEAAARRRFAALDASHVGYLLVATLPPTPVQQAIERSARKARSSQR